MSYTESTRRLNNKEIEYLQNKIQHSWTKKTRENFKWLMEYNYVDTLYCKTDKCIVIPEEQKIGEHYLFQIDSDHILWFGLSSSTNVDGKYEYVVTSRPDGKQKTVKKIKYEKFPNSEFEIVSGYGLEGELIYQDIHTYGDKLEPQELKIRTDEKKILFKKLFNLIAREREETENIMYSSVIMQSSIFTETLGGKNMVIIKGHLEDVIKEI